MSTKSSRQALDRDRIVAAAIGIADAEGLAAASMRRVAEVLAVTPMALYKHVDHRDHLVDLMVDHLLVAVPAPEEAGDWRAAVRGRILAMRSALGAHPWAREAIETRTLASEKALAHMEALMASMFAGGLSADLVHVGMHALSIRMWGFTRDVMPTPSVPDDPSERARAMADYAARYPAIVRMATTAQGAGQECDADAEFRIALDLLLDGIDRLHRHGWVPGAS